MGEGEIGRLRVTCEVGVEMRGATPVDAYYPGWEGETETCLCDDYSCQGKIGAGWYV